jgi:hypothetical protein
VRARLFTSVGLLSLCILVPAPVFAASYFVNDVQTSGDVYTTAPGNDSNPGTNAAAPKLTLTSLLAAHALNPGDKVFIDTGTYSNYTVTINRPGTAGSPIEFIGSTNYTAGGSVFNRNLSSERVFWINSASYVRLSDLVVRGGSIGVEALFSTGCELIRIVSVDNDYAFRVGAVAPNTLLSDCAAYAHRSGALFVVSSTGCRAINCSFWGARGLIATQNAAVQVSNCVIRVTGLGNYAYVSDAGATISGNYNVFFAESLADIAFINNAVYPLLADYQGAFDQEARSSVFHPQFAAVDALDFHPLSPYGRFVAGSGFVTNAGEAYSGLVDFGDPAAAFSLEPAPNGSRLNAGRYGNSPQASKSSTNPVLRALTMNDGGFVKGTATVSWVAVSFPPAGRVRAEYSLNGGLSWSAIATNVPATNQFAVWNTTLHASSARALWRVVSEANTNVADVVDSFFSVHNTNLTFYVNDTNLLGDVYTSAAGNSTNTGVSPSSPLAGIDQVIDRYSLAGDDIVYVDTGLYVPSSVLVIGAEDALAASALDPVRIVGSTNGVVGGTVLSRNNTGSDIIHIYRARGVSLENLTLLNGRSAIFAQGSLDTYCINVVSSSNSVFGFSATDGAALVLERCAAANNGSAQFGITASANVKADRCTLWGSGGVFSGSNGRLDISNSVIRASGANQYAYQIGVGSSIGGNYNIFRMEGGASFAQTSARTYVILSDYQRDLGLEWNSTVLDPQLANPGAGDFHPRSACGRWDGSTFVSDAETSPAIDFGYPLSAYANEPAPNGARVNVGNFGNTREASKSCAGAPRLLALTYNDGGTLNAPGDPVYWLANYMPSGATVRIEFSGDSGQNWAVAATNLPALLESYTWANTNFTSSRNARWRVVLESNSNVVDAADSNFVFRNGPFVYYVNDASRVGDVYTLAPGNSANAGTSPYSPKAALDEVLETQDLDPGDIVYVDTGSYPLFGRPPIEFTSGDSGTSNSPVMVLGSTNEAAGGTVLVHAPNFDNCIHFRVASHVVLRDLAVYQGGVGIRVESSTGIRLTRVRAGAAGTAGILLEGVSPAALVEESVCATNFGAGILVKNSGRAEVYRSALWRNSRSGVEVEPGGSLSLSNSVVVASGAGALCYLASTTTAIRANYNDIYVTNGALPASVASVGRYLETLSAWSAETEQDILSMEVDPLFASPETGDFHLKTQLPEGRYDPRVGWVNDAVTSPLIDSGDPAAPFAAEQPPHGGRIEIGVYGNTYQASRREQVPWLHAASLRSGGVARGPARALHWAAGALSATNRVRLEYSGDGGFAWLPLAAAVPVTNELFLWNTTTATNSPSGLWRVALESDPALSDQVPSFFSIRNSPLSIYVNDGSITGDVFTASAGRSTNFVATAQRPIHSLKAALDLFDVEPGDTLYVDTGVYEEPTGVRFGTGDSGTFAAETVNVIGSTNACGAGTLLLGGSDVLALDRVSGVSVSRLALARGAQGVRISGSGRITLDLLQCYSNTSHGVLTSLSTNLAISRLLAAYNAGFGCASVTSAQVRLMHSVIWSNGPGAVSQTAGSLGVTNSVLMSSGVGRRVFDISSGTIRSDYNDVLAQAGSDVSRYQGIRGPSLASWQSRTTNDLHSLSHDPLFADAAAGDFHLRSQAGRFSPASCSVVTDAVSSLLIDAGDPQSPFAAEPPPNGSRANIGLHGNLSEASRTRSAGWLTALSFNDGGSARGTNILYWTAGGVATGHTVRVEYSEDGGQTWAYVIATGVQASAGSVVWNSSSNAASPAAKWRVVSQQNPSICDASGLDGCGAGGVNFILNNGPIQFFVNDTNTAGDVYCTAAGSAENDGLSAEFPAPSLQAILSRYFPKEGDQILIDTGLYRYGQEAAFDSLLAGAPTNKLLIRGSTNFAAGGSVLDFNFTVNGIRLSGTHDVEIRDLRIINAQNGLVANGVTNLVCRDVLVRGLTRFSSSVYGFDLGDCSSVLFDRCVAVEVTNDAPSAGLRVNKSTGVQWLNGVLWSNRTGIIAADSVITVSNSVVGAFGAGRSAFQGGSYVSDYNDIFVREGAVLGTLFTSYGEIQDAPLRAENLDRWQEISGGDRHTLSHDPRFADPSENDFRLQSAGGRFTPGGSIVFDPATSDLLDAGNPAAPVGLEPAPNGGRINIGPHGGIAEASLTPTNPFLTMVKFNDGGSASGTNELLSWIVHGAAAGHPLRLLLSLDGGKSFPLIIATNLAAGTSSFTWNTKLVPSTPTAAWRIDSLLDPAVTVRSETNFTLHNTNFSFYVNDASTAGDVYCSAGGSATNDGLHPSRPMASLASLLRTYDVEPGDTIFLDTGVYTPGAQVIVGQGDAGEGTNVVRIVGSTNAVAGGTVFAGAGIRFDACRGLEVRALTVDFASSPGAVAVEVLDSTNTFVESVRGLRGGHGFEVRRSSSTAFSRCAAQNCRTNGLSIDSASLGTSWKNGVLWGNRLGASGGAEIRHSVIGALFSGAFAFGGLPTTSDYNCVTLRGGGYAGASPLAESLSRWVRETSMDRYSLSVDPGFANVDAGDFHLLSQAGRYNPSVTGFVTDASTSFLIDAGDPLDTYAREPSPNGQRRNIGYFGDTAEASKTPTNSSLLAVSLNDGGRAEGTNVVLYWVARGDATGHTVRLEFSADAGVSWGPIVTGLAAGVSSYVWNSTNFPSSILALWRVISERDGSVSDAIDRTFGLRNGPISFYVNDASTSGDVYTVASGSPANSAASPSAPKDSVQDVLDEYDVEPGDSIYVDTGTYFMNRDTVFTAVDGGDTASRTPVLVRGSTNEAAGGSRILRTAGGTYGILVNGADQMDIRNIAVSSAAVGVRVGNVFDCALRSVVVDNCSRGFDLELVPAVVFERCVARNCSDAGLALSAASASWTHGVMWSNRFGVFMQNAGRLTLGHSILGVFGGNGCVYVRQGDATMEIDSDYNDIYLANGARVATYSGSKTRFPLVHETLAKWTTATGNDAFSLAHDPGFVDAAAGDFHLLSAGGRYVPALGSFVADTNTSVLIDAGDPLLPVGNETAPNGNRRNIGLYGGTEYASRTPANARLVAASLNDGGIVGNTAWPLIWIAQGAATGHIVNLDLSYNGGASWQGIVTGLSARSGVYYWDVSRSTSAVAALWRIVSATSTGVFDVCDRPFSIRNQPFRFYVNDSSTDGDVYTTAPGNPSLSGVNPANPKASLKDVLDTYDLEPGDAVLVDTGSYLITGAVSVTYLDAWNDPTNSVSLDAGEGSLLIQGTTNELKESKFTFVQSSEGLALSEALGVQVRDLTIERGLKGSGTAISANRSDYARFERVRCLSGRSGISIVDCTNVFVANSVIAGNTYGLSANDAFNVQCAHSILWSNTYGVFQLGTRDARGGGSMLVENSFLSAMATGQYAYLHVFGSLSADYNGLLATNGGFIGGEITGGSIGGGTNPFERVYAWTRDTGRDGHSTTKAALFVSPPTNFHVRSAAGRYVPGTGFVTNAGEGFSGLIDVGRPDAPFGAEPAPNGRRVNIGSHGNTPQASKSPSNGVLHVLTLNDGGNADGLINLKWAAAGAVTGQSVRIEYSANGGLSWAPIASGVAASQESYAWDSFPFGRAAAGLWRILSESDASLVSTNDRYFALRNASNLVASVPYYVNDASTNCDVYCSAPGSDVNNGLLPTSPKASLQSLLDSVDLDPGDIVYMDSGTYPLNGEVLMGVLDAGSAANRVIIQGSTNRTCPEGRTVIDGQTLSGNALRLFQTAGIEIRDIVIRNAGTGVHVEEADDCLFSSVVCERNAGLGFLVEASFNADFRNCIAAYNSGTGLRCLGSEFRGASASWSNGVIWGHARALSIAVNGDIRVRNSLLEANGSGARIFYRDIDGGGFDSDYNNFERSEGAIVAEFDRDVGGNDFFARLLDWQRATLQDTHTLSHDSQVADSVNGDFHLQSASGRRLPNGSLTNDPPGVYSPLIDTGDPGVDFAEEPSPRGCRVNIGAFGNTSQESLSPTNPWLLAITLNDGGLTFGTQMLYWAAGNMAPTARVTLAYARDGVDYAVVASGLPADCENAYSWDVSSYPPTALGKYKVISESYPGVADEVDRAFSIKNHPILIYVNDSNTECDVYTTAVGSRTNSGSASQPLNDPEVALRLFPFGAGDTLFIDTGTYALTNGLFIGLQGDTQVIGVSGFPFRVQGSTNRPCGPANCQGTYILVPSNRVGLTIQETRYIDIDHLSFVGGVGGVLVRDVRNATLGWVECFGAQGHGFDLDSSYFGVLSHCAAWGNSGAGVRCGGSTFAEWRNGVVWSNRSNAIRMDSGTLNVRNSVLHAYQGGFIYDITQGAAVDGDYNVIWPIPGGQLARNRQTSISYPDLKSWQSLRGADLHSLRQDPLFGDPAVGDFHLQSQAGRYSAGGLTNDAATSWAIDAADPADAFAGEPAPNGSRVNAGLFGGTCEASRSTTNASDRALLAASLSDGGLVRVENQQLYWVSRALTPADRVTIEYSYNGGQNWVKIVTNHPALTGLYEWNTAPTQFVSSPVAIWRITLQGAGGIVSSNKTVFRLRKDRIRFYVNDASTNCDVYTTAPGAAPNDGLNPSTPMPSVADVVSTYVLSGGDELTEGDVLYVDTGVYTMTNGVVIRADDSGTDADFVHIVGSTNRTCGGTVLSLASTNEPILNLDGARFVSVSEMVLEGGQAGMGFDEAASCSISNLLVRGGAVGLAVRSSRGDMNFNHVVVTRSAGEGIDMVDSLVNFEHSVIWEPGSNAVALARSSINITNTVLGAGADGAAIYIMDEDSTIAADFNCLHPTGKAVYARAGGGVFEGLPQWTAFRLQDEHSIGADPLFANPAAYDYHVRSRTGRYNPLSQGFVTTDTNYSYLIDLGDRASAYALEAQPNGARANIGRHGNTAEASKSRTNDWLLAVTANSGGRIEGIFNLYWGWGGMSDTSGVSLAFSYDGGNSWVSIATNVEVGLGQYLWDSRTYFPTSITPIARWRVTKNANTNVYDVTDRTFGLNGPFTFYVNDASTNGDIYTCGPGDDANLGIYPCLPKATLAAVLTEWDIEGGDTVLIDTGVYGMDGDNMATVDPGDSGHPGSPVLILGSTNGIGTALVSTQRISMIEVNASYLDLRSLLFSGGGFLVGGTNVVASSIAVSLGDIFIRGAQNGLESVHLVGGRIEATGSGHSIRKADVNGVVALSGQDHVMENTVVVAGLGPVVSSGGRNVVLRNCTLVSGTTAFLQGGAQSFATLRNNILVANGGGAADEFCISLQGGTLSSDYNLFLARNEAWIGTANGFWEKLLYWQRESLQDANSVSADPLFANEAAGDFHLKSMSGRYSNGVFVVDAVHSPAIDVGDPAMAVGAEAFPNGGRINLGAYGGTAEASKSRVDPWVLALTANDGGVLRGTPTLRWRSGNLPPGAKVTLQYSADNGASWTNIAAGLTASAGSYAWTSTNAASSLAAKWRVVLDGDPSVLDAIDQSFALRNFPLAFYVNDASTTGDVFTAAVGLPGNSGLSNSAPKNSLTGILGAYDTEGGDTVYVDTGAYSIPDSYRIIWSRGGDATYGAMLVQGSTNYVAGGARFEFGGPAPNRRGLDVKASYLTLRDLVVSNSYYGMVISSNRNVTVERAVSRDNAYGLLFQGAISPRLVNSRVWNNASGGLELVGCQAAVIQNNTMAGNGLFCVRAGGSDGALLQNNIFEMNVPGASAILGGPSALTIDYNAYHLATNETYIQPFYRDLRSWQLAFGHDFRSDISDPLFANRAAGDFHLRSQAGRYQDGTGYVLDGVTSWAIDKGNPAMNPGAEPQPNGNRINLGAYGGTEYASKGRTNAVTEVRTLNQSTLITADVAVQPLVWHALNLPSNELMSVQYSGDGGRSWLTIQSNAPAYQEYVLFNASPFYNTYKGRWRVVGQSNTNYWDVNNAPFQMFFGTFSINSASRLANRNRISWRGAWDEVYQVQYSTNNVTTSGVAWVNALAGTSTVQRSNILTTNGGDFVYEDLSSTNFPFRMYRVIWDQY